MELVAPPWFLENKDKLLTLLGLVLVGILSFEAGLLFGRMEQKASVVLSLPAAPQSLGSAPTQGDPAATQPEGTLTQVEPIAAKIGSTGSVTTECVYVGSKNSNKYHLSRCAVAKRIKPENRVCFASEEEARQRGYVASCLK